MVRLVRLCRLLGLFRRDLLSRRRPDRAIAQHRDRLRLGLRRPPDRRLAVRHVRRPQGPQGGIEPVGQPDVPRLADDRACADLCPGGDRRADRAGCGAPHPGPQPGRRIWLERDLSQRNGGPRAPRLLVELPICDVDRRTIAGARAAARVAGGAWRGGDGDDRLAHCLRHRRGARGGRVLHSPAA